MRKYKNTLALLLVIALIAVYPIFKITQNYLQNSQNEKPNQHNAQAFVDSLEHDPKAGEKIYDFYCKTCHAPDPIIQTGAPALHNREQWAPYQKNGFAYMLKQLTEGLGSMPPRGGCFECSDRLLRLAILYMLPRNP
ncbi:MAG: cytochrome c5 family protein [Legionellales bacterium]|nr:cytochrome c5 family protein [Legionellales bacterium]